MKRTLVFLFVIILLLSLAVPVHAASNTYEIEELGLSVEIPSAYDVFSRDMSNNDPLFSSYGITQNDLMAQFVDGGIYLNAVGSSGAEEIVVTVIESSIESFNNLGDTGLSILASALEEEYSNYKITVTDYDIFHHPQLAFIRIYFHDDAQTTNALQYYTVHNGYALSLTMRSYTGTLSSTQKQTIQKVVDSVTLNMPLSATNTVEQTDAFVYTDEETGTTFTVPENWISSEFTEQREYFDAKFTSTEDNTLQILYGSTDMWSQMSSADKVGYTRSDFNNSVLTKDDIAEMLGTTASKVKESVYNGNTYFCAESVTKSDVYGISLSVSMNHAILIEDGWMYWFQFGGTSNDPHYSEFEKLLDSVEYTSIGMDSGTSVIAIILVFAVGLCVILFFVLRKKKTPVNQPVSHIRNASTPEPAPTPAPRTEDIIYCHKCGTRLPADSVFCIKCGTKMEMEE